MTRSLRSASLLCAAVISSAWLTDCDSPTGDEKDPILSATPDTLDFGTNSRSNTQLTISNEGSGTLHWKVAVPTEGWVTAVPSEGIITNEPSTITITIYREKAPAGDQEVRLVVTAEAGGRQEILLRATIERPLLSVTPDTLAFGEDQTSNILTIGNAGTGTLRWQLDEPSEGWIEVSRREGQVTTDPNTVDVSISREDAPEGQQSATLVVTDDKGGRREVILTALIARQAMLSLSASTLDFGLAANGKLLILQNDGSESTEWSITVPSEAWLQVTPRKGQLPGGGSTTVEVQVDRSVIELAGPHTTEFVVTANPGGSEIVAVRVQVQGGQVPSVTISSPSNSTRVTEGTPVQLQGAATDPEDGSLIGTSLVWSSDLDGRLGTGAQVTRALTVGTHVVTLTASDSDQNSSSSSVTITIDPKPNTPPVANAGPDRVVAVGENVTLDGSGSSDADGEELTFRWSADADVVFSDSTSPQPSVTIGAVGEYTITLLVSDGTEQGEPDQVVLTIVQPNASPIANAGADKAGLEGDAIAFDGSESTDSDGSIAAYLWSFGDGVTSSVVSDSHVFADDGLFVATLTVTDNAGAQATDTVQVNIANVAPVARANGPYAGTSGESIQFTGSAEDPGVNDHHTFTWSFGDGGVGEGAGVIHTYTDAGDYFVTLTVSDGKDVGVDTTTTSVTANTQGDPIQWSENGHYYELVQDPARWTDARVAAESRSYMGLRGRLVTIHSEEENAFVRDLVDAIGGIPHVWIGGFQPADASEPDGGWRWVTDEAWTYSQWDPPNPNDAGGDEDYLLMLTGAPYRVGTWNDTPNGLNPYVIEYGDEETATTQDPVEWAGNGHYYELVNEEVYWETANGSAKYRIHDGAIGHLVTIESNEENDFVLSLVQANGGIPHVWIGAFQPPGSAEPNGGWRWVTEEPWRFTKWDPPNPNNAGGNEGYVVMLTDSPYRVGNWSDVVNETSSTPYVVEYEEELIPPSYSSSGAVTLAGESDHSGARITFTRVSGNGSVPDPVETTSSGVWEVSGFELGTTYRATPSRSGWAFTPDSYSFEAASPALDFAGQATVTSELELEPNDSQASAYAISLNDAIRGRLSTGIDNDYYELPITGPGILQVDFTTAGSSRGTVYYTVAIVDASGNLIDQVTATTADSVRLEARAVAGTYFIRVRVGTYHSSEQYELTASFEAG